MRAIPTASWSAGLDHGDDAFGERSLDRHVRQCVRQYARYFRAALNHPSVARPSVTPMVHPVPADVLNQPVDDLWLGHVDADVRVARPDERRTPDIAVTIQNARKVRAFCLA